MFADDFDVELDWVTIAMLLTPDEFAGAREMLRRAEAEIHRPVGGPVPMTDDEILDAALRDVRETYEPFDVGHRLAVEWDDDPQFIRVTGDEGRVNPLPDRGRWSSLTAGMTEGGFQKVEMQRGPLRADRSDFTQPGE